MFEFASTQSTAAAGKWIKDNADAPITARYEALFVMVNNPTLDAFKVNRHR
jgi:hypothetical protein